ncbi:MAG TPA: hypothetical protein VGI10_27800 [Polyangiaceae bacterium]|jgi:hypothetical protein
MLETSDLPAHLPLTIPSELWSRIEPAQRERCLAAERLLDAFDGERELEFAELASRAHENADTVLGALQVLEAMALVSIEPGDDGPVCTLRAVPDEHVRFIGPNGRPQWLFVARPLDPPEVESASLN